MKPLKPRTDISDKQKCNFNNKLIHVIERDKAIRERERKDVQ